ncbi:MAG: hypothetical protein V4657_07360 [Pseudomonadota bacterium]
MKKHHEPDRTVARDRPVIEAARLEVQTVEMDDCGLGVAGVKLFADEVEGFDSKLEALNQRWENRITGKDLACLGENYARGRLSFILDFKTTAIGDDHSTFSACTDLNGSADHVIMLFMNENNICQLSDDDLRADQVVFVDVVGLPDFPEQKIASRVRLYAGKQIKNQPGEGFYYSSARWFFGASSGRHEGLTERFPAVVGRECYAFRASGFGPHHPGHQIIESAAHAMKRISDSKADILWERFGDSLNDLVAGTLVSLDDNSAKICSEVATELGLRLVNVAFGPIDL